MEIYRKLQKIKNYYYFSLKKIYMTNKINIINKKTTMYSFKSDSLITSESDREFKIVFSLL